MSASIISTGWLEMLAAGSRCLDPVLAGARPQVPTTISFSTKGRPSWVPARGEDRGRLPSADRALGHDLGERLHDGVEDPVADDAARAAGRGIARIDEAASGAPHRDRAQIALAIRDVLLREAADRAETRRIRAARSAVDGGRHLVGRAREIDVDRVVGDRDGDDDRQRLRALADAVDIVRRPVDAVRQGADHVAHHRLGMVVERSI